MQIEREREEYIKQKKDQAMAQQRRSTEQSELQFNDKKNEDTMGDVLLADRQENGDEIIEVVDCPGIDGARQRNTQGGQRMRSRIVI